MIQFQVVQLRYKMLRSTALAAGGMEEWQAVVGWIEQLGSAWSVRSYTDGRPAAPVLYHLRRT